MNWMRTVNKWSLNYDGIREDRSCVRRDF